MDEGKEDFLNKLALVDTLQDVPQFADIADKALSVYEEAGGKHTKKTQVAILGAASAIAAKLMRDTKQSLFAPSSGVAEFYQARGDSYEALTAYQEAQKDLVSSVEAMIAQDAGRVSDEKKAAKAAFVPAMYTAAADAADASESDSDDDDNDDDDAAAESGSRNGDSDDPRKGSFEWVRESWEGWDAPDSDRDKYLACLFGTTAAKVKMIADDNENDFDTIVGVLLQEHGEPDDDRACAAAAAAESDDDESDDDDVAVDVEEDDDSEESNDFLSWLTGQ